VTTLIGYYTHRNYWFILVPRLFQKTIGYTLSEAWSGVNWADLMAAQGAFGRDFYDRSILRPKHRAYYRSGRPVIKIGPKGALLGSHEIRPIQSAPSLGQSIISSKDFGPAISSLSQNRSRLYKRTRHNDKALGAMSSSAAAL